MCKDACELPVDRSRLYLASATQRSNRESPRVITATHARASSALSHDSCSPRPSVVCSSNSWKHPQCDVI